MKESDCYTATKLKMSSLLQDSCTTELPTCPPELPTCPTELPTCPTELLTCSIANQCGSRMNCCVPRCPIWGYRLINGHKISYQRFPTDEQLMKQWIVKTRVDIGKTFKLSKIKRKTVCSLHFTEHDFVAHGNQPRLKKGTVPSVFTCWDDIKHMKKERPLRRANRIQLKDENEVANIGIPETACSKVSEGVVATSDEEIPVADSETIVYASKDCFSGEGTYTDTGSLLRYAAIKLEILVLAEQVHELEMLVKLKDEQLSLSRENFDRSKVSVENLSVADILFYTGFPSLEVFNIVLKLLDPGKMGEHVIMKQSLGADVSVQGRKRHLTTSEQFLLVMCRLRLGLFENDLAIRFGVGKSCVSHIICSWINFMYLRLGSLNIWPSRAKNDKNMPNSLKEKYPSTRVIIDATELKVNMPSSLLLKSKSYSNCNSTNTVKGLVGITPGGCVCFLSQLYIGCISDKEITERNGFLQLLFEAGDSIMADKGFENIRPLLPPPFLGKVCQMEHNDVLETQSIAAGRIHVERAIRKIKEFHIFDQTIPLTLMGNLNQMWTVCGLLTLFQNPIIS